MPTPIIPKQGWHVLHLFYRIEHDAWQLLDPKAQRSALCAFSEMVQEIREQESTQLVAMSMVSPKSDLGFILATPDLQIANAYEKRLSLALGPDVLTPTVSFLSLTELSEYTSSEEDYAAETLIEERKLNIGSPEYDAALVEFRERMKHYGHWRLYPTLPDWPVVCFYPMSKRRDYKQNWYRLGFDARKKLMSGHARVGRQYAGRIRQLITGCTGLDDAEWGVTLFANNTQDIKDIVYEMRFDAVSTEYAEFGEFLIGLQLPLEDIFRRLHLSAD